MASTTLATHEEARSAAMPVRRIGSADLRRALGEGWADFMAMRGDIIFAAILYPLIGIGAAVIFTGSPLLPMLFPILAGVGLLGPLAAIGFYELARRKERGLASNWSHFLDVRKRPAANEIAYVAALLVGLFVLWLASAAALYVILWGLEPPVSIAAFLSRLFTTGEGWALILIGNLVGLGFAALVVTLSVVSLPMLVDRDVSASVAVRTSIRATRENPGTMLRWGLTVGGLLLLGSIPVFLGLAIVLPWLGYSTWHLYRRTVEPHEADRRA